MDLAAWNSSHDDLRPPWHGFLDRFFEWEAAGSSAVALNPASQLVALERIISA